MAKKSPIAPVEFFLGGIKAPTGVYHDYQNPDFIYVLEQQGVIYKVNIHNPKIGAPWTDLTNRVTKLDNWYDESGLLGLSFHPKDPKRLFLFYTTPDDRYRSVAPPDVEGRLYYVPRDKGGELGLLISDIEDLDQLDAIFEVDGERKPVPKPTFWQVLSEFEIGSNGKPKLGSERVLLGIPQYWETHNGGKIGFGPDGYFYIGTSDGGPNGDPRNNSQNIASLEGKILRIDVNKKKGPGGRRYGIPSSNPFVKNKKAAPEVYAFGLRNPWGLAWDTKKRLWTVDPADSEEGWEEVNIIEKGKNYGWRLREGKHRSEWGHPEADNLTKTKFEHPVYEYAYTENGCVIGGYPRTHQNKIAYIFGDFLGYLFKIEKDKAGHWRRTGKWKMPETPEEWASLKDELDEEYDEPIKKPPGGKEEVWVRTFGEDADGNLYVCTNVSAGPTKGKGGKLFRLLLEDILG